MAEQDQQELLLSFPEAVGDLPLLPARMVNEYVYCPRLSYLEWVQGEWHESSDTVHGKYVHRRVDRGSGDLPEPSDDMEKFHARSVTLSSQRLGIIAKIDLIEGEGGVVTPVDYKRGKRPHVAKGAYEPELIQVCVQGLLLEEHGYTCDGGILYFAGSKERVKVEFDNELRHKTLAAINGLRAQMIKRDSDDKSLSFDFTCRNRRPPPDPVNALLSFSYTLLVRTWTMTLSAVGFDPYRGFYHQPRYGRPALALDMMEPFRPLIAESAVISAINNCEVRPTDFLTVAKSVALTSDGRKRFIAAFERRLSHEITHPLFGYKVSYRRVLEIQARLLGRYLLGDIQDFPGFVTR